MDATRFWLQAKVQMEFLASLGMAPSDLVCCNFWPEESNCHVTAACFIRIAKKLGVEEVYERSYGNDQAFFYHNGIEFTCVCTQAQQVEVCRELNVSKEIQASYSIHAYRRISRLSS